MTKLTVIFRLIETDYIIKKNKNTNYSFVDTVYNYFEAYQSCRGVLVPKNPT